MTLYGITFEAISGSYSTEDRPENSTRLISVFHPTTELFERKFHQVSAYVKEKPFFRLFSEGF